MFIKQKSYKDPLPETLIILCRMVFPFIVYLIPVTVYLTAVL